jgi:hypothetical protein
MAFAPTLPQDDAFQLFRFPKQGLGHLARVGKPYCWELKLQAENRHLKYFEMRFARCPMKQGWKTRAFD